MKRLDSEGFLHLGGHPFEDAAGFLLIRQRWVFSEGLAHCLGELGLSHLYRLRDVELLEEGRQGGRELIPAGDLGRIQCGDLPLQRLEAGGKSCIQRVLGASTPELERRGL